MMAQFAFENDLNNVLRMDAPITKGPQLRWQSKLNDSLANTSRTDVLNSSSNTSCNHANKTPNKSHGGTISSAGVPLNVKTPSKSASLLRTPHKAPGIVTPSTGSKTPTTSDRFIPNRGGTQFELGHFLIANKNSSSDETLSPAKKDFQQSMNENLNGDTLNNKIISYNNKPPAAPEGNDQCYQNGLRVLYSASKTPGTLKKVARLIPQVPERILDAPEILDDYYLNLIDWSANNHLAVCLGGHVYLWNASNGEIQQLMEMENQAEYVSSVSWVKEGTFLAIGTSTGDVQMWDVAQQKRLRTMGGHAARVGALSWNNHILSSGSRSGYIHHHDVRVPDHLVSSLAGHTQEVCGLKWSPDGRYLASGGNDNLLNIWQAQGGTCYSAPQPLHSLTSHMAAVKALAWCPWQPSLLASGGGTADRHIRFWNVNNGDCVQSVDTKSQVCALLWSSEYRELVSSHGFAQNQLIIWKYPSLAKVAELTGHTSRVLHMAMSPDGSTVVSAAADETLRLWKCFAFDEKKKKEQAKSSAKKDLNVLMNKQRIR